MKAMDEKGLTLIEVVAVVAVLAILAGIAVPTFLKTIDGMRKQAYVANAIALKDAATFYVKDLLVHEEEIPVEITYEMLLSHGYIEGIKDPDSRKMWEITNASYLTTEGETVSHVCLQGDKRKLCGKNGETPVAIHGMDKEDVIDK
ncbi:prepilin-type N-terminal cleavage/methylation domain-containing protein [Bacillus sp. 1P06AnD]|uniref:prepilin-type N-terminal cleavage/methylation domain-containing protein n=1 Tax=Bacillus sp. 1P06AnD TaxID=3132208 RepID=UPI0039A26F8D